MKPVSKVILNCELIRVEKLYNQTEKQKYFYNLQIEGIDDLLLLETLNPVSDIVGRKIKYKLNSENEVSDFEFI